METILNIISRIVGVVASVELPSFLQKQLNICFVKYLNIDLQDFDNVESYSSIQRLFTRYLKKQRNFSTDHNVLISPTDSTIAQYGTLKNNTIVQVKGLSYDLYSFLTSSIDIQESKKIEDGNFVNFYLSPKDYHHFHAPIDFKIQKIVHVPGTLMSVKKTSLETNKDLYIKNERVILECLFKKSLFYFVVIGALNVGKIKIFKEPRLQTNISKNKSCIVYDYSSPIKIQKGEDLGFFEMGSSVVLLFEKENIEFLHDMKIGEGILFGDSFAKFSEKL